MCLNRVSKHHKTASFRRIKSFIMRDPDAACRVLFKHRMRILFQLFAGVALLSPLGATTLLKLSTNDLVVHSTSIVRAEVTGVRTATVEGKERRRGKFSGYRPDWKKAYVRLKEGQKMPEYLDSL